MGRQRVIEKKKKMNFAMNFISIYFLIYINGVGGNGNWDREDKLF